MIIGKHVEKIFRENKVILANKETGAWTRVSNEVFEILKYILDNNYFIGDLKCAFETEEDYLFIKDIYDSLVESNIICSRDYNFNTQNKIVSVQLTNRCNLSCTHCCVDAKKTNTMEEDLSTEQMKNIFDKLIDWQPLNIMLSGGEPMLRVDFMELLEYLRDKYKGKIILSTNSLFINNENVQKLARWCDSFEISIDGVDEETCSIVRGKGVFDKVCHNVGLLKKSGVDNINLSMVFSDKNQHLERQFYNLNDKLGTRAICRIFSAVGRGDLNKGIFSDKSDEDIYIPPNYLSKDFDEPFGIGFCSAGKKEIFIGYDGTLYPCPSYISNNFAIGNILSCNAIDDLLEDENDQSVCKYVTAFDPRNLPKCKKCDVKLFCWTCPGELRDIKTEKAFNIRCKLIKPILLQRVWEKEIRF